MIITNACRKNQKSSNEHTVNNKNAFCQNHVPEVTIIYFPGDLSPNFHACSCIYHLSIHQTNQSIYLSISSSFFYTW